MTIPDTVFDDVTETPRDVASEAEIAAEIARLAVLHGDHPNRALALHTADVLMIVAAILDADDPDGAEVPLLAGRPDHLCDEHRRAALQLLVTAYQLEGCTRAEILGRIPRAMRALLAE